MTEPAAVAGHVHVCHAHADAAYARTLADFLTRSGVPASAYDEPDSDWRLDDSRARVEASAAVVVVMTPAAHDAAHVEHEIEIAEDLGRPIFPLLLRGTPLLLLDDHRSEKVSRREAPPVALVERLRRAVGAGPGPTASWKPGGRSRVVAAAVAATAGAVLVAGAAYAILDRDPTVGSTTGPTSSALAATPTPSITPTASAAPLVQPGTVQITSHVNGQVVDRCERFTGTANLDPAKTMLFAKNRVDPADSAWYFDYVGDYRNGFIPSNWTGIMYFGTATRQSYDLFILVMDVEEAERFWSEHQSADGKSAMSMRRPGTAPAAHVRVRQGTLDDC